MGVNNYMLRESLIIPLGKLLSLGVWILKLNPLQIIMLLPHNHIGLYKKCNDVYSRITCYKDMC
jgi:hypothetical protein